MAAESIDRLRLLLEDVLAAAKASLTTNPAPTRSFVSHGQPVYECKQLTVHTEGITAVQIASPSELAPRAPVVVSQAAVVVTLLRCSDTSEAVPKAATLDAEGKSLATDGWELWRGLLRRWNAGTLLPQLPDVEPEAVRWQPGLAPIAAEGGMVGWTLGLTVRL